MSAIYVVIPAAVCAVSAWSCDILTSIGTTNKSSGQPVWELTEKKYGVGCIYLLKYTEIEIPKAS